MQAGLREAFVGRTRELEILDAGLAAAVDQHGGMVLLAGEPGIGKTRTLEEFARRALTANAEVLVSRCHEGDGAPAFWPWLQLLRTYVDARDGATLASELGTCAIDVAVVYPELRDRIAGLGASPTVDSESARFRCFDAVARALNRSAAKRPLVLLIDDLHAADEPSLRMLQFVAGTLHDARVLVVAGLRDLAFSREHPLANTLGELIRERGVRLVRLRGLTVEEVGELVAALASEPLPSGLGTAIHARTEGNPLYTREVAQALLQRGSLARAPGADRLEIPESVLLAIRQRVRSLPVECQKLLAWAALFGREFRADVLARVSGLEPRRALELLEVAQAERTAEPTPGDGSLWRFVHALFAETLAAELPASERASMHRRVAEVLSDDPRAAERAAELAHHWFEAGPFGDPDRAVAWSRDAAARALERLAHEEAARLHRKALRALEWQPKADTSVRAELLLDLGEACKRSGDVAEAKKCFLEAGATGRELRSPQLLTRAALGNAPAVTFAERIDPDPDVVRPLEEAIAAWNGRDSGLHACALARLSLALFFGDRSRSAALGDEAVAMARRIGDVTTLRYVLARWLATYLIRLDPETRLATATELVALGEHAGDLEAIAMGRLWRCIHSLEAGDAQTMRHEQWVLARLAEELRQPAWSWYAQISGVMCALFDGRFEDAERAIALSFEAGRKTLPYAAHAYFVFTSMILRVLQGRAGEFVPQYRAVTQGVPSPAALAPLAWAESELGNAGEVRRILAVVTADDFVHVERDVSALIVMAFLAEAAAFVGDRERASRLYEIMAPLESRWVHWVVFTDAVPTLGPIAHFLGLLARTMGRFEEAAGHFHAAIEAASQAGAPAYRARAQYEYAVLLRSDSPLRDDGRARRFLADARATAAATGMAGLCAKIDALGVSSARGDSAPRRIFRRDGDLWTIAWAGKEIRVRDMRGLHYLATLLREPSREFHATDLVRSGRGPTFLPVIDATVDVARGLGDAGERLDPRARSAYRARVDELDEEIAESERMNDLGRLGRAREQREALLAELRAAARGPRVSSDAERARLAATKGIKAAIDRIAASHSELGAHLRATVRRGYFCSYAPGTREPVEWET